MKARGLALFAAVACAGLLAAPTQAATPDQAGQWGPVQNWPIVSVHASLEPSGNVLAWDGFDNAPNSEHVFNPSTGTLTPKPYARNLFCSGYAQLPDGRLLIAGGHIQVNNGLKDTTLWDTTTNTATRGVDLQNSRWYPTVTTLADGRAMVFSGDNIEADDTPPGTPLSFKAHSLPEVFNPTTSSYTRLTTAQLDTPLYPFMFVLPDGRVFQAGPDQQTHILNPNGTGSWSNGPVSPIDGSSAVMYSPGKVMKSGTWSDPSFPNRTVTGQTAVIDMNQPSPTWRQTSPMAFGRSYENLIALPDGTVLGTGGTSKSDGVNMANAVLPAELWNPQTETWTTMSSQAVGRGYHTTALLLPDGRVLEAGGGRLPGYPIVDNTNVEIFSPPYLFKGIRPQISSAPSTVRYGSTFDVGTLDAAGISKVSLVRLGSSTHNFDQNQRFVPLNFSTNAGSLTVTAPSGAGSAPPGYYMLFIVNSNGVPSVASFVRFPAAYEDSQAPSAPGSLQATGSTGTVNLNWNAATDDTGIKQYNVHRGTAPGFTPTTANRITQTTGTSYTDSGLAAGTYYYRVTAEDQAGNVGPPSNEANATASADSTPPSVSVSAPSEGSTVSGSVNVTANAADDVGVTGVQFKLDGNNLGGEDTSSPYSVAWDTSGASNGSHTLTAVAKDAAGNTRTATTVNVTVSNTGPPAGGPVLALGFDETSGSTVGDSSGRNNNGSITGATRTTSGKYGGALSFNGSSNLVTVPDSNSLDLTTGMTLEAWVNPTAATNWRTAILKETSGNLVYSLYSASGGNTPGKATAWINADGLTGPAVLTNTWSHIATTYDGTTWRFYLNGTQVASQTIARTIPVSTGALRMGGNNIWGEWFAGQMDEVRVYDRALSALEVVRDRDTAIAGGSPPPADTTAPSVSVTAPADGSTVSGTLNVTASASDNVGVTGVQFKLDGNNLGNEDTSSPYSVPWDTTAASNGTHTLTAVARDAAGNTRTATTVTVTVSNTPPDATAPTVSLTAPSNGASVSGSLNVTADASDNVGVTGVQFKLDGNNLGNEDTSSPYSVPWDTTGASNGNHTLTAVAKDAAGNTKTSATVTVTVNNPDNTPPTVSLTAPLNGATVSGGSVGLTANASDNVGVTGVQFKVDGNDIGNEDTGSPYSASWDSRTVSDGSHALTAVAKDAAGNSRTSTTVNVTVNNADATPPTVSLTAPLDGAVVSNSVDVTANASDNVGVTGVQFKLDGNNLGNEDTGSPYSVAWDTKTASDGSHALTAVAKDAAGNAKTSSTVNVTVANNAPAGLVAAYGFDEPSGSTTSDASGKGNTGTISGATRTTTSKFGRALSFNGSSNMVTVPDSNSLDLTTGMTLEAWVRTTVTSQWRTAILKEKTGDLVYALYPVANNGTTWRPGTWIGGTGLTGTSALTANTWTHVATTYDGTNWRLYINGTQAATRAFATPIAVSTGPLRIGGNSIWGEWWSGQLDEIRIYNRGLSAAEIAADRDRPITP